MRKYSIVVVVVLIGCLLLGGCAGGRLGQAQGKGAAVGAGVGAVVCGVLGYLVAGRDGAIIGAALGAALGGAVGYAYATHMYEKIEKASNKAEALDKALQSSGKDVAELQQAVEVMEQDNKKLDEQTKCLAEAYANKKISAEKLVAAKRNVDRMVEQSRESLDIYKKEHDYLETKALPVAQEHGNEEQVAKLKEQIATVNGLIARMEHVLEERAGISANYTST